jgi:hypothetical protein
VRHFIAAIEEQTSPRRNRCLTPCSRKHRATLEGALNAIATRGYWSAYNEMPSPKTYGETAAEDGKKGFRSHLGKQFELGSRARAAGHGGEQSPYGVALDVQLSGLRP